MPISSNEPVFTIGTVSGLIHEGPATIRIWERNGLINPSRKGSRRYYSENDLKRLEFIKSLMDERLNIPAIVYHLRQYPCWFMDDCPSCMYQTDVEQCVKRCWKAEGTYCRVVGDTNVCANCEIKGSK